jgi:putative FmdB family regulatory protein
MPTYNYKCKNCDEIFTLIHPMSDDSEKKCITCDNTLVRKPMTDSRPTFKGEGFYTTDRFN